jgi:methionine-rich copper-binding protein CopC
MLSVQARSSFDRVGIIREQSGLHHRGERKSMQRSKHRLFAAGFLLVIALCLSARPAESHAVLLESTPAAKSTVTSTNLAVRLRFNVRIEARRSRLSLFLPDNSTKSLEIQKQSSPDTLTARTADLKPGSYRLRWQVLASDGHITRGDIPFTVSES